MKSFRQTSMIWHKVVRESKLEPFRKFAKLIRRYQSGIKVYISSRLTTVEAEGLNNKIKVLKRMGQGYTNPISICRKILQRCGYQHPLSVNTEEFFYKWPDPSESRRQSPRCLFWAICPNGRHITIPENSSYTFKLWPYKCICALLY